jgi:hypothetical protein
MLTHANSESLLSSFSSIQNISITYFHEPAIFKSLPGEVHPILLIQELKAIKSKQDNNSYIKQVKSIKLLHDDCHKQAVTHIRESRRFESMYTLQGKTQPTRHMLSTLSPHMVQDRTYLTWSTYSNLLHSRQ